MAISQIEEKILGKLARQTEASNPLLAANLYQILGLSILLSQKLYRAKKLRKLDTTRDTKSLQLYHQIIWLAREGLSITEIYILPYCQEGEQGPECRVMAAKLRASLYHIFCLFHNHPPVNGTRRYSSSSSSPPSSNRSPKQNKDQTGRLSSKSPGNGNSGSTTRRRKTSKNGLRDPIPSMTSDASYITNPYASPASPPPAASLPPLPPEASRTPSRPPGLKPIKISSPQAAASFLLPPLNFVPMAREHFEATQHLATTLLPPAHALRLAASLEHAAFLWDCLKDHEQARSLAARTIKEVYSSSEGLDDDEFADAAAIVQALGGIVKRGSNEPSPNPNDNKSKAQVSQARAPPQLPLIDRTIAISPPSTSTVNTSRLPSLDPSPIVHYRSTPDRLSTVPEDPSQETSERENDRATTTAPTTLSPSVSRLSSRASGKTGMSSQTDKAAKRRVMEAAEQELYRRRSQSAGSRQTTPVEGISASTAADRPQHDIKKTTHDQKTKQDKKTNASVAKPTIPAASKKEEKAQIRRPTQQKKGAKDRAKLPPPLVIPMRADSDPRRDFVDRRRAVLRALEVIASSSKVLEPKHKHGAAKRIGLE